MSFEFAIEIENLSKCFYIYEKPIDRLLQFLRPASKYSKEYLVFDDVSFKVKKGETFGIIGRNGAGKSTLLQIVSGTLNPTQGDVKVEGRVAALLELGAGFNSEFTGKENVYIAAAIYGLSNLEIDNRFSSIVEFSGIGDFIDQPVKTYSSGMYLRLAFSVIAHVDASILIIDEALSVGDMRFQQKCLRFLSDFKNKGGTLLFVSHDTSLVMSLCERALYLARNEKGYVSQVGAVGEIIKKYTNDNYLEHQNLHEFIPSESIDIEYEDAPELKEIENEYFDVSSPINSIVEISSFRKTANSSGDRGAQVLNVETRDLNDQKIKSIKTGESICLVVKFQANREIKKPAVTIIIKDRSGQYIVADGTVIACSKIPLIMHEGDISEVKLNFQFPELIEGTYALDVTLADGDHFDHKLLQWMYEVLELRVSRGRNVVGLCGLQNLSINWNLKRIS